MKKLFIIAAAACVTLASCVKNEPVQIPEQGELITFETPLVAPATKADPQGQVLYPGTESFKLYGWYHATSGADFANMYIPGAVVSKVAEKNYFAPSTAYYWPKSGYLSFFAYSPSALPDGSDGTLSPEEMTLAKSMTLTYTVPSVQAKQADLLYSDWAMNKTSADYVTTINGGYNGIEIVFNHALSGVIFSFAAEANDMYKINSVTLAGVNETAILTSTPSSTSWGTPSGDPVSYTVIEDYVVTTANVPSQMLMLIPQGLESAKLTINYSIKNPSAAEWIPQTAKVIDLNSAKDQESNEIDTWSMGTKYTYNIVFGAADLITFAPSIKTEWVGVTGSVDKIN